MSEAVKVSYLKQASRDYVNGLLSLITCSRELKLIYLLTILDTICFLATTVVLGSFLTKEMGLSDPVAGTIYGMFLAARAIFMLFIGFLSDSIGVRRSLALGFLSLAIGALMLSFSLSPWLIYPGMLVVALGFSFVLPILAASVRIYSTKKIHRFAFSWYYVVMNIGALIGSVVLEKLKSTFTDTIVINLYVFSVSIKPMQMLFLVAAFVACISILIILLFVRERSSISRTKKKMPLKIMKDIGSDKLFWLFILFLFILVLVEMIFEYYYSVFPAYTSRIGLETEVNKLSLLNPLIIIFLVPVITAFTNRLRGYYVVVAGAFIIAGSVFFMGFGESLMLIALFTVAISVGEAVFYPRLYDYTAEVAPPGQLVSYMALSKIPLFFGRILTGPTTGILLYSLCPEQGDRNSELMWIIIGMSVLIAPVVLILGTKKLDVEMRRKRFV
ncbi:MAG: MFS transporter [Pseudomonadota bacterium]